MQTLDECAGLFHQVGYIRNPKAASGIFMMHYLLLRPQMIKLEFNQEDKYLGSNPADDMT